MIAYANTRYHHAHAATLHQPKTICLQSDCPDRVEIKLQMKCCQLVTGYICISRHCDHIASWDVHIPTAARTTFKRAFWASVGTHSRQELDIQSIPRPARCSPGNYMKFHQACVKGVGVFLQLATIMAGKSKIPFNAKDGR